MCDFYCNYQNFRSEFAKRKSLEIQKSNLIVNSKF